MRKIKGILVFLISFLLMLIITSNKVNAESELYLKELDFLVQINQDASINITEYWNIDVEETNTLYKTFKTDYSKYTRITDVKVIDITESTPKELLKQYSWEYHVDKGNYFGTYNSDGDFEIGWGVGLDNSYAHRKYKIEYKVENAITKYKDYAELYWQLLGNDFGISAKKVTGTILLPENAKSKEEIKVWGHIETLNGEIYATDLNKIEFEVDNYNSETMLEIRTLFPTDMIKYASREYNVDILQEVVNEETQWAEEANRERLKREVGGNVIIGCILLVINTVFIVTIVKANKNPIKKQEKIVAEQEHEYYRDIPRSNATPGEAVNLLKKEASEIINNNEDIGKIFSAVLLTLKLKGYIDFIIDETKNEKEKISIKMLENSNTEELFSEEKDIYEFLEKVTMLKENKTLTLKELQEVIRKEPRKISKLGSDIGERIYLGLAKEKLLDEKQAKEYVSAKGQRAFQSIGLTIILIIIAMFIFGAVIKIYNIVKLMLFVTSIMEIISITKLNNIIKRANAFTQKGVNEIEAWKGLKKYMEDFSLLSEREVPEIEIWEKFLVFATAFGIAEKVIEQLKMVYPNYEQLTENNHSITYVMLYTNFNRTFSTTISSTMSSAYSSGSGSGGGFSGGGGGGGGRRWRRRTLNYKNEIKN